MEFSFIMKNNLYIINTNFPDHWQQPLEFFNLSTHNLRKITLFYAISMKINAILDLRAWK